MADSASRRRGTPGIPVTPAPAGASGDGIPTEISTELAGESVLDGVPAETLAGDALPAEIPAEHGPVASQPARSGESPLALKRRARRINRALAEQYPYAHAELVFRNPFELLVATVLSAQTTD